MVICYDELVGHRFVANQTARVPHERGAYLVRTNAQGFRSDTDFQAKKGERPRILLFGDSFTAGDGCNNHERYSSVLERELGAEVYNFGVSGTGTDQQLLIYEHYARHMEADLIILAVQIENIARIQRSHRSSRDRTTGNILLVPKPYFTLDGDRLVRHHDPVPVERPLADSPQSVMGGAETVPKRGLMGHAINIYKTKKELAWLRELGRGPLSGLRSKVWKELFLCVVIYLRSYKNKK